jgi:hypothetical protein
MCTFDIYMYIHTHIYKYTHIYIYKHINIYLPVYSEGLPKKIRSDSYRKSSRPLVKKIKKKMLTLINFPKRLI